jgi:hypothetical protein
MGRQGREKHLLFRGLQLASKMERKLYMGAAKRKGTYLKMQGESCKDLLNTFLIALTKTRLRLRATENHSNLSI